MSKGLIIAAPASGAGKTTVTLALLRALARQGVAVNSMKIGPDYIDPAFHAAASGGACLNFDLWAMQPPTLASILESVTQTSSVTVTEGVMGLFDGAVGTAGSTAEVAKAIGWPVILVVDASAMAASAAALVHGFSTYDPDLKIAGVIFNRIGSPRHETMLREACEPLDVAVLGALTRRPELNLPDRHLGLVQAREHPDLERFLEAAATWLSEAIDLERVLAIAAPGHWPSQAAKTAANANVGSAPPVLGQHIAIALDDAFAFCYPHVLAAWRLAGAQLSFFSPLADEAPQPSAQAIYLPGGYPELHAGELAAATRFKQGMRLAARRGAVIYGECGGYMVLGRGLVDAQGERHQMLNLLGLESSFAQHRLTLGYRRLAIVDDGPLGAQDTSLSAHEFHYASTLVEDDDHPLFCATDARGNAIGQLGLRRQSVCGSFAHIIDFNARALN